MKNFLKKLLFPDYYRLELENMILKLDAKQDKGYIKTITEEIFFLLSEKKEDKSNWQKRESIKFKYRFLSKVEKAGMFGKYR